MPLRNALATVRLGYKEPAPQTFDVEIEVWSRTHDDPNAARRSSVISGVFLTELPPSTGYNLTNAVIKDRYGVEVTGLWIRTSGANEEGFTGYAEYDTAGACGPGLPSVFWSAFSGIYDERCLADPSVDARRLQTYRINSPQITAYNYLTGPLTFSFRITIAAPPKAVRLHRDLIGGNGGNPAQHTATLPPEDWVIRFP